MADYNHIEKNFKSEENPREVISGPRQIQTNPMKTGGPGVSGKNKFFFGAIPYMEDDFNRPKFLAQAEREYHLSKIQDKNFSQKVKRTDTFNTNRDILEENPMIPVRSIKPRTANIADHDRPFKPSQPGKKKGHNMTFAAFPVYENNPFKSVERKMPVEGAEEEIRAFKPTHIFKTRPSPSVACNLRNVRTAFPSIFRPGTM